MAGAYVTPIDKPYNMEKDNDYNYHYYYNGSALIVKTRGPSETTFQIFFQEHIRVSQISATL
jgi:hypothetical protein